MISHIQRRTFGTFTPKSIGFIGLGQMGNHMANNLVAKSNLPITVFDTSKPALDAFLSKNSGKIIKLASSPKEVAMESSVIVTMLPSSPHVKSVYLEKDSILEGLKARKDKNVLLIDSSTIDPQTSRTVSTAVSSHGVQIIDAPVSGGVGGAEAGTLTFMVGGPKGSFDAAEPFLKMMGKNIVYCGDYGTGQIAKICNNMLLGISMLATSETMNLGIRLGIDPKVLSGIIASSSGRNWSLDTYNPVPGIMEKVPSSRGYTGGFAIELMTKDLQLAAQAATESKSFNLFGNLAKGLYEQACASHVKTKDGATRPLGGNFDQQLVVTVGKDFSSVFLWMNDNGKKYSK